MCLSMPVPVPVPVPELDHSSELGRFQKGRTGDNLTMMVMTYLRLG